MPERWNENKKEIRKGRREESSTSHEAIVESEGGGIKIGFMAHGMKEGGGRWSWVIRV